MSCNTDVDGRKAARTADDPQERSLPYGEGDGPLSPLLEQIGKDMRSLRSNHIFIIGILMIMAINIVVSYCACWDFVDTWTPRVTTWTVIDDVSIDALRTYWDLLLLPYMVMFSYVTNTVVSLDKGRAKDETSPATKELVRRSSLSKLIIMMGLLAIAWTASIIIYPIALWALAIPIPDFGDVILIGVLPYLAIVLSSVMVLVGMVFTDRRGFTNRKGIVIVTALILMEGYILAHHWYF